MEELFKSIVGLVVLVGFVIAALSKAAREQRAQAAKKSGEPKQIRAEDLPEATRRILYGTPGVRRARPAAPTQLEHREEEENEGEKGLEEAGIAHEESAPEYLEPMRPAPSLRQGRPPRVAQPIRRPQPHAAPRPVVILEEPRVPPLTLPGLVKELIRQQREATRVPAPPPPPRKVTPRDRPRPALKPLKEPMPAAPAKRPRRPASPQPFLKALLATREDLRKGIVLREILGPPKGLQ
jgi:hypothetical protein